MNAKGFPWNHRYQKKTLFYRSIQMSLLYFLNIIINGFIEIRGGKSLKNGYFRLKYF